MTPAATRGPELPVTNDCSCPPLPISSAPEEITKLRPTTEWGPHSVTVVSVKSTTATP